MSLEKGVVKETKHHKLVTLLYIVSRKPRTTNQILQAIQKIECPQMEKATAIKYLRHLEKAGLLEVRNGKNKMYHITEKGRDCLERFVELCKFTVEYKEILESWRAIDR
ncbi:MAG: hypothetical protein DRP02_12340 [Candidatus Gerdarchaeota archaeon]|nr:MAG: hypothetical protein DRP02_12340 [Candidatus Gerdarchaeota archaeon]